MQIVPARRSLVLCHRRPWSIAGSTARATVVDRRPNTPRHGICQRPLELGSSNVNRAGRGRGALVRPGCRRPTPLGLRCV